MAVKTDFTPKDILDHEKKAYGELKAQAETIREELASMGLSYVVTLESNLLVGNQLERYQVKEYEKVPNGYESVVCIMPTMNGNAVALEDGSFPGTCTDIVAVERMGLFKNKQQAVLSQVYLEDQKQGIEDMMELLREEKDHLKESPEDNVLIEAVPDWAKETV
jgi:hypothetical protein